MSSPMSVSRMTGRVAALAGLAIAAAVNAAVVWMNFRRDNIELALRFRNNILAGKRDITITDLLFSQAHQYVWLSTKNGFSDRKR